MSITIAQVVFLATAISLSVLILLQQSKGAGMGASFGAGASGTVFGARGSSGFLYKLTRGLAIVFFISALALGYLQNKSIHEESILTDASLAEKNVATELDVPGPSADNSAPASRTDVPAPAPAAAEQ
ncbi:preprotein translocase subunit SecG [Suttonella sp. R2A3]|uniref:preprotein translocase subunit SecG n=1 Tax=Suttonella sp. R2A3 TaxID=2908648 RepID=UPI001F33CFFF|nr:preprotein translocase subunit SecG [Suttonella sp. R2A3]UJF24126.1 preprotein translocase subunit SecG [Suttonella sp. R2A3]